ncbi:recombinase family protein [Cohnella sp. WQ 127256]|uniref:recombinase family protein n=1 Tax=Cohnella sp. WQ 127256 TaxID=2938790 RepID=UPI0021196757|nr:recombinase family protein [Cohnella sp. WQ 127256]
MSNNKIPVVGYARVSTAKDEQDHSYDSQKLYFSEVIRDKYKGFELTHIYADKKTATKFQRKDFLQMIQDGGVNVSKTKATGKIVFEVDRNREPQFKYILVSNLSRFARDTLAIDPVRDLKTKGVNIIFLDSGKSTENESDWFHIELMFTFAANESRDKSIKMKDGFARTAKRGALMTKGLFGYDYIKDNKELVINEEEAETVRKIYELYNRGEGFRRIINNYGLLNRNGNQFPINSIKHVLSNEKYYGTLVRNKWDSGVVFNKHYPKVRENINEENIHHDVIPAIISKETFDKAQQIRAGKISTVSQKGIYKGISEFAGLIKCKKCGEANYVRNVDRGKHYFICAKKKSKGKAGCDGLNFHMKDLENAIDYFAKEGLALAIDDLKFEYEDLLIKTKEIITNKINNQSLDEANHCKLRIDDIDNQKKRLLKLYMDGSYDKDMLDNMLEESNSEQKELQEQYVELSMSNEDINKELSDIDQFIKQIYEFIPYEFYYREQLIELIDKIVAGSYDGTIDAKTGINDNTPVLMLEFHFKPFKQINQIIGKYMDKDLVKISESISWDVYKRRKE